MPITKPTITDWNDEGDGWLHIRELTFVEVDTDADGNETERTLASFGLKKAIHVPPANHEERGAAISELRQKEAELRQQVNAGGGKPDEIETLETELTNV